MQKRRRFKQSSSLNERLQEQATRLREQAEATPPGVERDRVIRRARHAETTARLNDWLASPGLRPPT